MERRRGPLYVAFLAALALTLLPQQELIQGAPTTQLTSTTQPRSVSDSRSPISLAAARSSFPIAHEIDNVRSPPSAVRVVGTDMGEVRVHTQEFVGAAKEGYTINKYNRDVPVPTPASATKYTPRARNKKSETESSGISISFD